MFEKLCRLCANLKDDLVNIFDNTNEMQKIQWQVYYILHIRIQPNDVLPTGICGSCVSNLQKTFDFVSYCHNVQKTFKQHYEIFVTNNGAFSYENFQKHVTVAAESNFSNIRYSCDATMNLRSFRPVTETGYFGDFFSSWQSDNEIDLANTDQNTNNYEKNLLQGESASKSETPLEKNTKFGKDELYAVHAPDLLECSLGTDNSHEMNENDSTNDTDYHPSISSDEEVTDSEGERPSPPSSKKVSKTRTVKSSQKKPCRSVTKNVNKKSKPGPKKREKLVCEICRKTFATKTAYEDHLNIHTGNRPYACKLCEATFRKVRELKQHTRTIHSNKQFNCSQCSYVAKHKGKLTEHIKIIHEKPLKCSICNYRTGEKSKIVQHIANKHSTELSFICEICGSGFKTNTALQSHRQNIHFPEPKMCQTCGILLPSVAKYNAHIFRCGKEKQRYPCEICGETYVNKEILKEHMNKHHGITPYECDICRKEFYQRNRLDAHRFVHLKPGFQCEICNQTFKRKDNMKKHMNRHFPTSTGNSTVPAVQGGPSNVVQEVHSQTVQEVPSDAVQALINHAAQEVPNYAIQGGSSHAVQGVPSHVVQGVPSHTAQGIPSHDVQGVPSHAVQGVPSHTVQGVPNNAVPAVPNHAIQAVPNHNH